MDMYRKVRLPCAEGMSQREAARHADRRPNIPSAELESAAPDAVKKPVRVAYERRDADLDPQRVWRGKTWRTGRRSSSTRRRSRSRRR